jgi:RND family efflux transporter MFP subunit
MIRILLVDDQNLMREGLQALLEHRPRLKIVGTAKDGNSAIERVKTLRPDVVLIDIEMPGMSGITATQKICQQFTLMKVLVLSSHENQEYVVKALQAGAQGYLLKNTLVADDLEHAIWSVYRGYSQLESKLLTKALGETPFSQLIDSVEKNFPTEVGKELVKKTSLKLYGDADNVSVPNVDDKCLPKIGENIGDGKNSLPSKITKDTLKSVLKQLEPEIEKTSDRNRDKFERVKFSSAQKNRKERLLWLLLGITIFCGNSVTWLWPVQDNASVPKENKVLPVIAVELQKLSASTIKDSSDFAGVLEAQQRIKIRSETDGQIVDILVGSGERVKKGTPLIRLRLSSMDARVISSKAVLNQAKSELQAAEAEQSSRAAELELQKEEFERMSSLVTAEAQSLQDLDQVKRDYQATLATFKTAQKRVEATKAKIDKANADIQQAKADANLEQKNLRDIEVVAPIAGMIGDIPVRIGDYVETTNTLTTVTQNQTLELRLAVPTEYTFKLRIGMPVELRTSQGGNPLVVGKISFISPRADTVSQAILVKAHFLNPQGKLQYEQFVRARIIWHEIPGVLVPSSAITRSGGQAFVFVAKETAVAELGYPQQVAEQRPVKLGLIQGNHYQVTAGLDPGETIITNSLLNLSDGSPIMESEKKWGR